MKLLVRSAIPLACAAALFACRKEPRPGETTTTGATTATGGAGGAGATGTTPQGTNPPGTMGERPEMPSGVHGGMVSTPMAMGKLLTARCDREGMCNNIGPNKQFASRDACMKDMGAKLHEDIRPSDCPNGMDAKMLDDCVSAIQKEACTNVMEPLSRMNACNVSGMCVKGK